MPRGAGAWRIEHRGRIAGKRLGRQRVAGEVSPLDRDASSIRCGARERCCSAFFALDRMHRPGCSQREGEGAEPSKQVEHRAAWPDGGEYFFDENGFGRFARLQKGAWRISYGNAGQQHSDRAALHDEDLFTWGPPDNAGEVAILGKSGQRLESAELRALFGFDQHIDAAVGTGQCHLRGPASLHHVAGDTPQSVEEGEKPRLEHWAFPQVDKVVAKPFAKPDPCRESRVTRSHQPQPRAPSCRRNDPQLLH